MEDEETKYRILEYADNTFMPQHLMWSDDGLDEVWVDVSNARFHSLDKAKQGIEQYKQSRKNAKLVNTVVKEHPYE